MSTFRDPTLLLTMLLLSCKTIASSPVVTNDTIHHVGELFGGGIIFYVDQSKKHGLICSMSDIRDPLESTHQATSVRSNTKMTPPGLKQYISNPDRASQVCENYTNSNYGTGQFSDWYLPSIDELQILYNNKDRVNQSLKGLSQKIVDYLDKVYWSSSKMYSEISNTNWNLNFDGGTTMTTTRPITCVRAIRKF